MNRLEKYENQIRECGNSGLADSIEENAKEAWRLYLKNFDFNSYQTILLLGNVQSGKTAQMFGIICKASREFPVFLLLTTDNNKLYEQTLERVRHDLGTMFLVCGETETKTFEKNELNQSVIIVLKKNYRILKLWRDILANTRFMRGNPLFIVDDEGDAASLNTQVNKNKKSAINQYLDWIKNEAIASLYLQVTGTPQALLLQTVFSGWKPMAVQYFKPGRGYLGGNFFFPQTNEKPECIEFLEDDNHPIRSSVVHHLVTSAQTLCSGSDVSNALYHPGVKTDEHSNLKKEIEREIEWARYNLEGEFKKRAEKVWQDIHPEKSRKAGFEELWSEIKDLLMGKIDLFSMNSKSDQTGHDHTKGCNFIVGGNTLGRGVTFPKLNTVYYTRKAKAPQADTMWQHARMFGYDRDPGMIKVWITKPLFKVFTSLNAANNSMISQIENGLDDIKLCYPEGVRATQPGVLDNRYLSIQPGGVNLYPFNPENKDVEKLNEMLSRFIDDEKYHQVSLNFIIDVLRQIIPSPDFDLDHIIADLKSLISDDKPAQAILIVRTGRNVTQGTGSLISPNDRNLGSHFKDLPVLTIYKMAPEAKGWKQPLLWVPNIKLPEGRVFY